MISKKNRYWGLALPMWECPKCKSFEVIGSFDELKEKASSGWNKFEGHTPHKPWIDEVKIKCSKCRETVERIADVGNPWLDAGIIPYSTIDESQQKDWLPADFITESFPGQFKNWFYSLIAMSTVLENKESFRNVLGFATLYDEKGKPMHKSSGNMIEFMEGADKIGVDVMRWMYARQNPAENMLFGYKIADEVRRRFHLKLWNVYNFFVTYANLDGWSPSLHTTYNILHTTVLDEWILTRLNQTIKAVTEGLDEFDAFSASDSIEKFIDDLSLWYVRRSRSRVGPAADSETDKNSFYHTTYYVLRTTALLLAPFTPFLSDTIYKNLTKEESVHLADWPNVSGHLDSQTTRQLISEMKKIREIVEKAHAVRKEKKIPVRQPLSSFLTTQKPVSKNLEYLLKDEINVKKVVWNSKADKFDTKITRELEEESKARELMRKVQEERKNMGLNLTQKVNVINTWIPKDEKLKDRIMRKAQVGNISLGEFNVKKI